MNHLPEDKFHDTICAISTPPGVGGIAVVRISGPNARRIAGSVWQGKSLTQAESHRAMFGHIIDTEREGELLDDAVATIFVAPRSFTGEDTVELAVHGSRYVQRRLLELLIIHGARMAEAGEFTRRAFANGKMDLTQAEAVADVIASNSRAAHRIATSQMRGTFSRRLEQLRQQLLELASLLELELDFSEEDVEFASRLRLRQLAEEIHREIERLRSSFAAGQAIKEGIPVAIIGPTNAGKSSLLNALLGDDRAIVSDIHGTTRDTIEETLTLGDYTFRFIDTAGLRHTSDPIEALGIARSRQAADRASIILSLTPADTHNLSSTPSHSSHSSTSSTSSHSSHSSTPTIHLLTKADLLPPSSTPSTSSSPSQLLISSKTGEGLPELRAMLINLADQLRGTADEDTPIVTNLRHTQALTAAAATTRAILEALNANLPGDLIAQDLRATIHHLSTITGTLTTPDILASIFTRFCIGK